ncbi:transposable element Tcb1 transposase [Trichonephila clavipes]|uniref:Transposable element Tcb1 transposase n=1 Tax=Trichonephila clavipes TaxID=2585209 RepID=A0A8X6WED2_TRICX|nr:transposable element Tcb1 transposase [Trichonephila clavipes]
MSRRKQRSVFDQVSEFDREKIVAYRDCGLSFGTIGSPVGRKQTTLMRICDRWMQDAEWSVCKTSFAWSTLDAEPQTSPPSMVRSKKDVAAEWNEVVFTDESRICLQHHDGRIRVWRHRGGKMRNSCVMHHHTGSASSIMVWGGIRYLSRTPVVRIASTLNSQSYNSEVLEPVVLPYLQGLATAIFQQNNARTHVALIVQRFFVNHQIKLHPWLSGSFADRKHVVHGCSTIDPDYTPRCHTRSTLESC